MEVLASSPVEAELLEHVADLLLDRLLALPDAARDLSVAQALCNELEHLPLARRQLGELAGDTGIIVDQPLEHGRLERRTAGQHLVERPDHLTDIKPAR